jgi:hypothetical protein
MPTDSAISQFNDAAAQLRATGSRRLGVDFELICSAVTPFIEAFVSAPGQGDRSEFAASLTPDALDILRTFVYDSPVMAVRRNAPALIKNGLSVLAILGEVDDPRDLTVCLAKLYHSATK